MSYSPILAGICEISLHLFLQELYDINSDISKITVMMTSVYSQLLDDSKPVSAFYVTYIRISLTHLMKIFYSTT